jgi:hypothetical protein
MAEASKAQKTVKLGKPVYKNFIGKLQRAIDGESGGKVTGRSKGAAEALNEMFTYIIDRIAQAITVLNPDDDMAGNLSVKVAETALVTLEGLYPQAYIEFKRAIDAFDASTAQGTDGTKKTQADRAELIISPPRVRKQLMRIFHGRHISKKANVGITAAAEYVMSQVLLASKEVLQSVNPNKVRIYPRHIMLAVESDVDLATLFKNHIIAGGITPIRFEGFRSKNVRKSSGGDEEDEDETEDNEEEDQEEEEEEDEE